MQCEPAVDLGDDPRTARVSMPVPHAPEAGADTKKSKTKTRGTALGYTMETDPLHVAYHIANRTSWSQLLAYGWTPKNIVTSGVTLRQLLEVYGWQELISWGFDAAHFATLGASAVTFRSIPPECLVDFRARDVLKVCPTIEELLATAWTPSAVRRMGFTWKQLRKLGIERALHDDALYTWQREFDVLPGSSGSSGTIGLVGNVDQVQEVQEAPDIHRMRRIVGDVKFRL